MSSTLASSFLLPACTRKAAHRCATSGRAPAAAAASRPPRRTSVVVRAMQEPEQRRASTLQTLNQMFRRYDFVSAGLGALAVTTFCVSRGQDPQVALWITAASTVVALLVNDMCEV